jgi:hypothetical protein
MEQKILREKKNNNGQTNEKRISGLNLKEKKMFKQSQIFQSGSSNNFYVLFFFFFFKLYPQIEHLKNKNKNKKQNPYPWLAMEVDWP